MRNSIIPPVGTQVNFWGERMVVREEFAGFRCPGDGLQTASRGNHAGWDMGHYEIVWTPPTGEERQMFRDAAEHMKTGQGVHGGFCSWFVSESGNDVLSRDVVAIAESLAMDGM